MKDYLGNEYPSLVKMCEHYNLSAQTYYQRINKLGWSQEKALTTPVRNRGGCFPVRSSKELPKPVEEERYFPKSNLCSVEYLRYLQYKIADLRIEVRKAQKVNQEKSADALYNEISVLESRIREARSQPFLLRAMDLCATHSFDALYKFTDKKTVDYVMMVLREPQLMSDLMKEIYITFNEEFSIVKSNQTK